MIDALGGAVAAIEEGYIQKEIAESAYRYQEALEAKEEILVGVNKFTVEEDDKEDLLSVEDSIRQVQIENINALKKERDNKRVASGLEAIESAARSDSNLVPVILEAVEAYATLGEIADVLRKVFGEY